MNIKDLDAQANRDDDFARHERSQESRAGSAESEPTDDDDARFEREVAAYFDGYAPTEIDKRVTEAARAYKAAQEASPFQDRLDFRHTRARHRAGIAAVLRASEAPAEAGSTRPAPTEREQYRLDLYSELAEALGSDCMDSHKGRLDRARRANAALKTVSARPAEAGSADSGLTIPYVRDDELVRIGVGNLSTTMSARQWFVARGEWERAKESGGSEK